jgi:TRAP-type C4-dicarboxylate transport system permease small subunit
MQRKIKSIGIGYIIFMLVASIAISIPNFSTTIETILKVIFVAAVFGSALLFRRLLKRLVEKAEEETRNGI